MRSICFSLAILALASTVAVAQGELAPSEQDGPITIPTTPRKAPEPQSSPDQTPPPTPRPVPDANGVYRIGLGVLPPTLIEAASANYPDSVPADDRQHTCLISAIIGADSNPEKVEIQRTCGEAYDKAAIESVEHSRYAAGQVGGKPVPILAHIRVTFAHLEPAIPVILRGYGRTASGGFRNADESPSINPAHPSGITMPKPIYMPEAEFSEQARRAKVNGTVVINFLVQTDGTPTDLKVTRPLGSGLDEKALEAVRQYRFQPAMFEGKPTPVRITVEVSFKIR